MSNETNPIKDAGERAGKSVQALRDTYAAFIAQYRQEAPQKVGIARLFQKWFSFPDPTVNAPVNQSFLDQVDLHTRKLADTLETLKESDASQCDTCALAAAEVMLAPKPNRSNSSVVVYQMVAESNYQLLLPYLTTAHLQQLRQDYLAHNPKYVMLPKQLELLKQMSAQLEKRT